MVKDGLTVVEPTGFGDSQTSSGACGDLNWKVCMMMVKKRKSSILARPSPKQFLFPEEQRRERYRWNEHSFISCSIPTPCYVLTRGCFKHFIVRDLRGGFNPFWDCFPCTLGGGGMTDPCQIVANGSVDGFFPRIDSQHGCSAGIFCPQAWRMGCVFLQNFWKGLYNLSPWLDTDTWYLGVWGPIFGWLRGIIPSWKGY